MPVGERDYVRLKFIHRIFNLHETAGVETPIAYGYVSTTGSWLIFTPSSFILPPF